MKFKVKKLSEHATVPTRVDSGAAGFDLYSAESCVIPGMARKLVKTNVAIQQSQGFYGKIEGRSGLAYKNGIDILAGVIDENYTGDLGVVMLNTSEEPFEVNKGDRIAQIIFHKYFTPELEDVNELNKTERGEKGFGASGK